MWVLLTNICLTEFSLIIMRLHGVVEAICLTSAKFISLGQLSVVASYHVVQTLPIKISLEKKKYQRELLGTTN